MRRGRIALLAGGAVVLVLGGLWLARKPIAAGILEDTCKKQGLTCDFKLSRLNFGGVTLRDLALSATGEETARMRADRLAVDLQWTSPFSARAGWVGGNGLKLRLNATGEGPLLGGMQDLLDNLPERDPNRPPAPTPRVSLRDIEVVADTVLGPVRATGQVLTGEGGMVDLRLSADPVTLQANGSELKLAAADFIATSDGQDLKGRMRIDLPVFKDSANAIQDLKLDLELEQSLAAIASAGSTQARAVAAPAETQQAELQAGPVTVASFPTPEWLAGLKKLSVAGVTGAGALSGARWSGGEVRADISSDKPGAPGGDVSITARGLNLEFGKADTLELTGRVSLPTGEASAAARRVTAEGVATVTGGSLDAESRTALGDAVRRPLQGALPSFAGALADGVIRAGERFDFVLPWSLKVDDGGFDASMQSGAGLTSASGFAARFDSGGDAATFSQRSGGSITQVSWQAAGVLKASGGGLPAVELRLEDAKGQGGDLSARGRGAIGPWKVGGDSVSAQLASAEVESRGGQGRAAAAGAVAFGGNLGGVSWSNGRADGEVMADWTPDTFRAQADDGLSIAWDAVASGETRLGAGALRYAPNGALAERRNGQLVGTGELAAINAPVSGKAFSGRFATTPMKVSWSAGQAVNGQISGGSVQIDLQHENEVTPIRIASVAAALRLDQTWRLSGSFAGGSIVGKTAAADGAGGKFSISGGRRGVDGVVQDVVLRMYDPSEDSERRFEPVRFEGGARINAGVADFTGELKLGATGMVLMAVTGRHDLGTGDGGANFAGRLRFSPAFFQPARLSPLFRGPANVTGGLALGGSATWTGEMATAKGIAQLDNLGFALANAGIFEGVSGRVEVADLFNLKSDPGQKISIRKVTLGAPFENGEIQFQLAGYEGIKLERASWPFAGGEIRVRPSDLSFQMEGTHVVAEAVGWDLEKVMETFKVPDVKVRGRVNGRFPITFTTGSARIDKAILLASEEGGVLQYTGSTGDAAGRADPNAKMLFDALNDFRFKLLELELDGDLAGDMDLKLRLQGNNPQVLSGGEFHINIGIDAPLMALLNMQTNVNNTVRSVIDEISGGAN